jgi:tol-pal system protein YbgF
MYQGARQQLNRGSLSTARGGFQQFLAAYPGHALVPDALYSVGETFYFTAPDSAVAYYTQVVTRFPKAAKAATALYKMGRLEEDRKNVAPARGYYQRLLKEYPSSDEAGLARNRLQNLRPPP